MNAKSPASGRAPRDGLNVEYKPTEQGGRGAQGLTFKQRTRYSSVTLEGKLAVRGPGYEAFDLATTIGKGMAPGGTFRTLLSGEIPICVLVRPFHRDKVLELAGITDRSWRTYVAKWEARCMAHRCSGSGRDGVTLFFDPQPCCVVPGCGATLPPDRKQRSARTEAVFHTNGSSVPRIVLRTGDASRDERRDARSPLPEAGLESFSEPRTAVSEIAARIRVERNLGLADRDVAALLNGQQIEPPEGFAGWTGYAVRVALGEAVHAA